MATKNRNFASKLRKYFREYNEVTGIHGLRYLTEKRSRTEKVIWAFLLLLSLAGCIYMIYEIFDKFHKSPVVVNFATQQSPIYTVPFPSVTICPESKYSSQKFNYSYFLHKVNDGEPISHENLSKLVHLSRLCFGGYDDYEGNETIGGDFYETINELNLEFPLMGCSFMDEGRNCTDFFTPIMTDVGICYSFNILDRNLIYRDHVVHYRDFHKINKNTMSINEEFIYNDDAGVETHPRRALMTGLDNGLIVLFQQSHHDVDHICSLFLQGYRVSISNPFDVPRLDNSFFFVPLDKVLMVALEPELVTTSEKVQNFSPDKRECFFRNEKKLKHFKLYTQSNCQLECLTDYTLNECKCVDFDMPRDNKTKICEFGRGTCLSKAMRKQKIHELENKISGKIQKGENYCDCKPPCTELKFKAETSQSNFHLKDGIVALTKFKIAKEAKDLHMSALVIYFKSEQFIPLERNELYGVSDLISNFGGLLGLFTGFSLISLMEIIYFLSLRIWCNIKMYRQWPGPPD